MPQPETIDSVVTESGRYSRMGGGGPSAKEKERLRSAQALQGRQAELLRKKETEEKRSKGARRRAVVAAQGGGGGAGLIGPKRTLA